jgi:hypothetical protein
MVVQGREANVSQQSLIDQLIVSHRFFETMEIPIAAGRGFSTGDNQTSGKVAVINESAVRKFFPNENPLGRRFGTSPETSGQFEIVGVVRDARYNSLRESAPPTVYFLYAQRAVPTVNFRDTHGGRSFKHDAANSRAVRKVDPNLPLLAMTTQTQQIAKRFEQEWILAQAYTLFGSVAAFLACTGLFGSM